MRLKTVDFEALKAKLAGTQNELRIRVTLTELHILWSELSRRKLSPTLATA